MASPKFIPRLRSAVAWVCERPVLNASMRSAAVPQPAAARPSARQAAASRAAIVRGSLFVCGVGRVMWGPSFTKPSARSKRLATLTCMNAASASGQRAHLILPRLNHDVTSDTQRFSPRRGLAMTITITAFERSPDGGKGLARDMRVRWALEEVGQPYQVRLVSFRAMKEPAHRSLHPFGQIPTYEEGDLVLFETGAIVFHLAERHAGLLPDDANAQARAITWMFAALNTVEPPILELSTARILESDKPWNEA